MRLENLALYGTHFLQARVIVGVTPLLPWMVLEHTFSTSSWYYIPTYCTHTHFTTYSHSIEYNNYTYTCWNFENAYSFTTIHIYLYLLFKGNCGHVVKYLPNLPVITILWYCNYNYISFQKSNGLWVGDCPTFFLKYTSHTPAFIQRHAICIYTKFLGAANWIRPVLATLVTLSLSHSRGCDGVYVMHRSTNYTRTIKAWRTISLYAYTY